MTGTDVDDRITAWVETNVGGTVVEVARQPRWRPVWFVDVERDGVRTELVVRGERTDAELMFPLCHEMTFQRLVQQRGIPVPPVHGWIDDLDGIDAYVMDRVPGRPDFDGVPDAERDAVVDEYVQALVQLHRLEIEPFVDAGIERAATPEESGLVGMARYERAFRAQKNRPDPLIEFGLGWLRRNPPRSKGRERPIVWDSGQFHHADGHLVAMLDLELAHLGDPMMDLAGWRMRDSIVPYGDFDVIYDRYAALTGEPVDLDAIELHHFAFTMANQLSFSHTLRDPAPETDYMTNLQWCNETNLYTTEFLGEHLGIDLPTVDLPEPRRTQTTGASKHLARSLRSLESDDPYVRYRVRSAFRLATHLDRYAEIGAEVEADDLDDLEELLGHRPASWLEGEAELERFVLADADAGRHDEQLVPLLHKRNLRAHLLNGAPGSAMTRHNPIQGFER